MVCFVVGLLGPGDPFGFREAEGKRGKRSVEEILGLGFFLFLRPNDSYLVSNISTGSGFVGFVCWKLHFHFDSAHFSGTKRIYLMFFVVSFLWEKCSNLMIG